MLGIWLGCAAAGGLAGGIFLVLYMQRRKQNMVDASEQPAKRARREQPAGADEPPLHVLSYKWRSDNVFAAIQAATIPAEKLYELEHTYALLDKQPVSKGHTLVVTKHSVATLCEGLPPAALASTLQDLQTTAQAVQRATGCSGLMVRQNNGPAAGQTVPQLHFHVIPVYPEGPPPQLATPEEQERPLLAAEDAGPLAAAIQNALPRSHSPADCHAWVPSAAAMEALGMSLLSLCIPGTVICLNGQLGTGKTCIARGAVRAFCRDPQMFVPSPTFLLNLSYTQDTGHEALPPQPGAAAAALPANGSSTAAAAAGTTSGSGSGDAPTDSCGISSSSSNGGGGGGTLSYQHARSLHHMDPYRLGNADKMAGLIDFPAAFKEDICLIEWPDRMPPSVMSLPRNRTLMVNISGSGAQGAGRLVHISLATEADIAATAAAAASSSGGKQQGKGRKVGNKAAAAGAAGGGGAAPPAAASSAPDAPAAAAAAGASGAAAANGVPRSPAGPDAAADRAAHGSGPPASSNPPPPPPPAAAAAAGPGHAAEAGEAAVRATLQRWREQGLPEPRVAWRAGGSEEGSLGPLVASALQLPEGPPESYLVLGIESSCDDTAAAVVRGDGTVLGHKIASQTGLHEQYGGVKPDVARDAHAAAIASTVESCLEEAGVRPQDLTAVAVTIGPGLSLCLQVGVRHAMSLAAEAGKPVIPVHHMEAHALVTRMPGVCSPPMEFPALVLLISGGHNMLVKCEGVGRHRVLGTTIDDSVGEAFDKTSRLLGITAIPGGPALERLAASADPASAAAYRGRIALPLRGDKDSCNFSFSGIKTSVAMLVEQEMGRLAGDEEAMSRARAGIAAQFQEVCVKFLTERTRRALQRCQQDAQQLGEAPITCLVVAGGVAANGAVRAGLDAVAAEFGIPCVYPPVRYCTDNGLMVAWTGLERLKLGLYRPPPPVGEVERSVEVLPRWPLGPVDVRGMAQRTKAHLKLLH